MSGVAGEVHLDRPSVTCVGPERDCNDGWDNDCDGLPDAANPDCAGKVSEQCADLVDDDADGKIDCADPDCVDFPSCKGPRFEQCADLVDNDADGKTDCDDPDCAEFSSCKEQCADLVDNDGDGKIDCDDRVRQFPSCKRPGVGGADGAAGKGGPAGAPGVGGAAGTTQPPPGVGGATGTSGAGGAGAGTRRICSATSRMPAAAIVMAGNPPRNGYWYTYNDDAPVGTDPLCGQTPPAAPQAPNGQWVSYGGELPRKVLGPDRQACARCTARGWGAPFGALGSAHL